ncbi:signal peptidase I SipW [Rossellomorea sp. BNER]|uniref:signal peptidase I SipW n=1 Tax=Rossellomorea sp. BNER TaxID=2962031 RepID=UPI003AF27A5B|nr:signal peptidase I [Rossellomorea sp. BNER]
MIKKAIKAFSNLLSAILFSIIILTTLTVMISKASSGEPNLFGYQLKTVLSGSMEPSIQTGSVIAVKPVEDHKGFQKGDIITFINEDDLLITHRVIEVKSSGNQLSYITKGDNNDGADRDPVLPQNVKAEYTGFTVPYAGYFLNWINSKIGSALLLIIPGLLLITYSIFAIRKALSGIDRKNKNHISEQRSS